MSALPLSLVHASWWACSWSSSSKSNEKSPWICSNCSSNFFQHSQSAFAIACFASNSSVSCTASHFVKPSFWKRCRSLKFCLERWVSIEGRGGSLLARAQDNGEGRPPSWCVVVMEDGMVVMGLLQASLNGSGLWTMDFDQIFGRIFRLLVTKVYGGGKAAMVHVDHLNSWWGVDLLIPMLKHTNEFYFVWKFHVWPMSTPGRYYNKCVIVSSANFLSNVTNPSRQRDSQKGFLSSFTFHQTKWRTRIKLRAFILVGKSAVPSHEACRRRTGGLHSQPAIPLQWCWWGNRSWHVSTLVTASSTLV